jgi:hypothetical protein
MAIFREVFFEGYITLKSKPMYNYRILSLKYMINNRNRKYR